MYVSFQIFPSPVLKLPVGLFSIFQLCPHLADDSLYVFENINHIYYYIISLFSFITVIISGYISIDWPPIYWPYFSDKFLYYICVNSEILKIAVFFFVMLGFFLYEFKFIKARSSQKLL